MLLHLSRKAMAGEFEICLPMSIAGDATPAAMRALDLIQSLERQLSYFRPDSEISQINRTAVERAGRGRAAAVRAAAIGDAACGARAAGPTTSPPRRCGKRGASPGGPARYPPPEQLAEAKALVGGQWVELDERRGTIRFHRAGVRLNLGSIGKGYAVDRAVELLLADGLTDFLVHGGYSSVAARGAVGPSCREGQTPPEHEDPASCNEAAPASPFRQKESTVGWTIGVKDPLRADVRIGQIELLDRALGTSGAQHQSFRHQGKRYGHILDPRIGWPAEGVLAVSVVASTAAEADALSTAFYVLGTDWAMDYCRQHPSIAAVVFCPVEGNRWEMHDSGVGLVSGEKRVGRNKRSCKFRMNAVGSDGSDRSILCGCTSRTRQDKMKT